MRKSDVSQLGFWSALLTILWVILFGTAMVLGIMGISPGGLPFAASWLLAVSFLVMMTAIHYQAPAEKQIWSHIAVSLAVIYAVCVMIVYYIQLTVLRGSADSALRPFVYAPGTVFFAIDMLGYASMCFATWFAAPVFTGRDRLSAWLRFFLILHGVVGIGTLIAPAFMVDTPANAGSKVGYGVLLFWCAIFIPLTSLVAAHFRRSLSASVGSKKRRAARG